MIKMLLESRNRKNENKTGNLTIVYWNFMELKQQEIKVSTHLNFLGEDLRLGCGVILGPGEQNLH